MQNKIQTRHETSPSPNEVASGAMPGLPEHAGKTRNYEQLVKRSVALALVEKTCATSVEFLNQILADTMTLRDLYKKHRWQVLGPKFTLLYLLYEKHCEEQEKLIDVVAERIQLLGGVTVAMGADVAKTTIIPQPPREREEVPAQLSRLLDAHELVIHSTQRFAAKADDLGDVDTHDMLVGDVLRINELQVWFLSERLRRQDVAAVSAQIHCPRSIQREESQVTDPNSESRSEELPKTPDQIGCGGIKIKANPMVTEDRRMDLDPAAEDQHGSRFAALLKNSSEVLFRGAVLSLTIAAMLCLFSLKARDRVNEDVVLYILLALSLFGIIIAGLSAVLGLGWRRTPEAGRTSMRSTLWTT